MKKSKKEMKGMLVAMIGLILSIIGMSISTKEGFVYFPLVLSVSGILVILLGLVAIFKANRVKNEL
jgi:TctA family transporter